MKKFSIVLISLIIAFIYSHIDGEIVDKGYIPAIMNSSKNNSLYILRRKEYLADMLRISKDGELLKLSELKHNEKSKYYDYRDFAISDEKNIFILQREINSKNQLESLSSVLVLDEELNIIRTISLGNEFGEASKFYYKKIDCYKDEIYLYSNTDACVLVLDKNGRKISKFYLDGYSGMISEFKITGRNKGIFTSYSGKVYEFEKRNTREINFDYGISAKFSPSFLNTDKDGSIHLMNLFDKTKLSYSDGRWKIDYDTKSISRDDKSYPRHSKLYVSKNNTSYLLPIYKNDNSIYRINSKNEISKIEINENIYMRNLFLSFLVFLISLLILGLILYLIRKIKHKLGYLPVFLKYSFAISISMIALSFIISKFIVFENIETIMKEEKLEILDAIALEKKEKIEGDIASWLNDAKPENYGKELYLKVQNSLEPKIAVQKKKQGEFSTIYFDAFTIIDKEVYRWITDEEMGYEHIENKPNYEMYYDISSDKKYLGEMLDDFGVNRLISLQAINLKGEMIGILEIGMNLNEIAPIRDNASSKISVSIFVQIILSVLVNIILLTWVLRQINPIHNALKKITKGNLNAELKVKSHDEFSVISKTINTMVQSIKKQMNSSIELSKSYNKFMPSAVEKVLGKNDIRKIKNKDKKTLNVVMVSIVRLRNFQKTGLDEISNLIDYISQNKFISLRLEENNIKIAIDEAENVFYQIDKFISFMENSVKDYTILIEKTKLSIEIVASSIVSYKYEIEDAEIFEHLEKIARKFKIPIVLAMKFYDSVNLDNNKTRKVLSFRKNYSIYEFLEYKEIKEKNLNIKTKKHFENSIVYFENKEYKEAINSLIKVLAIDKNDKLAEKLLLEIRKEKIINDEVKWWKVFLRAWNI